MSECCTTDCNREVTHRAPPSLIGNRREFCTTCYNAWRREAMTTFTNGVPRGELVVDDSN